jgi:glycosidase
MVDAVINHISAQSDWFQNYLICHPKYSEYFISVDPDADLSMVVRPRDLPLLTSVSTSQGDRSVWTTFSEDQIDLNYANPKVLLEIIDLLLFYVRQGARFIRLDAIAFLWKEIGTPCIHLPQTHSMIQLLRAVIDSVAPSVLLITETNVPHKENLSYFGDGTNEAHLVYQFALPPLVLHALLSGNAEHLSNWATDLRLPSDKVTFFNFLASHDGIGLRPVHNILSEEEIQLLLDRTEERGGKISYRTTSNGGCQPYELNINYLSALTPLGELDKPSDLTVDRFIVSQAIMLSMAGLPGIYFHSLVGSLNWAEGAQITQRSRTINRKKFQLRVLDTELNDPQSLQSRIFHRYIQLLQARRKSRAFEPFGHQTVLEIHPSIFCVARASRDDSAHAICLHNLSAERQYPTLNIRDILPSNVEFLSNLLQDGKKYERNGEIQLALEPYQVVWLADEDDTYA